MAKVIFFPIMVAALTAPAVLNGYPLIFFGDSRNYINNIFYFFEHLRHIFTGSRDLWAGVPISLDRSLLYSFALVPAIAISNAWITVVFQAGILTAAFHGCLQLLPQRSTLAYALTPVLALCTPLGLFAGLLMPDIFAPILIMLIALLAVGGPSTPLWTWSVTLLAIYAASAHTSHAVLLLGLTAVVIAMECIPALRWPGGRKPNWALLGRLAGICAATAFFILLNSAVMNWISGGNAIRMPFMKAHLIDLGPGHAYLGDHCNADDFVVCRLDLAADITWEEFLFGNEPGRAGVEALPPADRPALGDEQLRFAWAVLQRYPLRTVSGLFGEGLEQLARFRVNNVVYAGGPEWHEQFQRLPRRLGAEAATYRLADLGNSRYLLVGAINLLVYATLITGAILLMRSTRRLWVHRHDDPGTARLLTFAVIVTLGVIGNGLICGILASPFDRFQARVIGLIPFVAMILAVHVKSLQRIAR